MGGLTDKQPNYKNLKRGRWKPGQSGNPNGRPPKKKYLSELLEEEGKRVPTSEFDGLDGKGVINDIWIARALYRRARNGDVRAIELILERREGKVTQPIGGEGGGPVTIKVVYGNGN